MKRLPKGLKKITKHEFVKEISEQIEEQEVFFPLIEKECIAWSKNDEKKSSKRLFRW